MFYGHTQRWCARVSSAQSLQTPLLWLDVLLLLWCVQFSIFTSWTYRYIPGRRLFKKLEVIINWRCTRGNKWINGVGVTFIVEGKVNGDQKSWATTAVCAMRLVWAKGTYYDSSAGCMNNISMYTNNIHMYPDVTTGPLFINKYFEVYQSVRNWALAFHEKYYSGVQSVRNAAQTCRQYRK